MKSFKRFLKEDWWDDLGPEGQEAYINEHPNSAKAKSARAEKNDDKESSNKNSYSVSDMKYIEKHPQSEKALRYKFDTGKELTYKDKHNMIMKLNDKEVLRKLADDDDVDIRIEVAGRILTPEDVKAKMAADSNAKIRAAVAWSTRNPELLKELSKDKKVSVRKEVIGNGYTSIETLEDMATNDYDETEMDKLVERITDDCMDSFKDNFHRGAMSWDEMYSDENLEREGKELEKEIDRLGYRKLYNILKDRGWEPDLMGYYKFTRTHPSDMYHSWSGYPTHFVNRDKSKDKVKPGISKKKLDTSKYEGEYTPSSKKSSSSSSYRPYRPYEDEKTEKLRKIFRDNSFGSKDAMNRLMDRDEMEPDDYSFYIKNAEDDWDLGDLRRGLTSKKFSSKNIDEFVNKVDKNPNYIRFLLNNPNLTKDNLKNMYNKAKKIDAEYTLKDIEDKMKKMENK